MPLPRKELPPAVIVGNQVVERTPVNEALGLFDSYYAVLVGWVAALCLVLFTFNVFGVTR